MTIIQSIRTSIYIILLSSVFFSSSFAQDKKFSISINKGLGYYPLNGFVDFLNDQNIPQTNMRFYSSNVDKSAESAGMNFNYNLNDKIAISLNVIQKIEISATSSSHNPVLWTGTSGRESWDFSLTPVDLTVNYYFIGRERFSPYIGIGPSFNIKKLNVSGEYFIGESLSYVFPPEIAEIKSNTKDTGLGFNAIIGFQIDLFRSLFLESSVKARYTDSLKQIGPIEVSNENFEANDLLDVSSYGIDLSNFDFTFGLGIRL